jgi:hypothetical protein
MPADPEIQAMETVQAAVDPLSPEARQRVLQWVASRFDLALTGPQRPNPRGGGAENGSDGLHRDAPEAPFPTFADLYDAAGPTTEPDRALVGGYWFQVVEGADSFPAQPVNTALKNLGHPIGNITNALTALKTRKPALVLQLQKHGKTKQARKVYKLTEAGVRRMTDLINGTAGEPE